MKERAVGGTRNTRSRVLSVYPSPQDVVLFLSVRRERVIFLATRMKSSSRPSLTHSSRSLFSLTLIAHSYRSLLSLTLIVPLRGKFDSATGAPSASTASSCPTLPRHPSSAPLGKAPCRRCAPSWAGQWRWSRWWWWGHGVDGGGRCKGPVCGWLLRLRTTYYVLLCPIIYPFHHCPITPFRHYAITPLHHCPTLSPHYP